ncbi:hypothetical protein H1R20_g9270, partial [Candolleomyces eurysporus]
MGFDFAATPAPGERKEVWTSLGAVAQYVQDRGYKKPYMLLLDSARTEFSQSEAQGPHDAVIIGLAPKLFDYEHLNTAFRILKGEDQPKSSSSVVPSPTGTGASGSGDGVLQSIKPIPLIATHKAKYVEKDDPPGLSLGPGPFVTALENATGCEAYVVGKPTKTFFRAGDQ